jgi:hypothetical protein
MIYGLLLSGAVRAALVLAVGLVAYALLSRASAATRRFVLVLTLGAAIVVPIAAAVGPRWTFEAPAALSAFARESDGETASSAGSTSTGADVGRTATPHAAELSRAGSLDVTGAIVLAWLVIAAALLVRATASQILARAISRRATPVEKAVSSRFSGSVSLTCAPAKARCVRSTG